MTVSSDFIRALCEQCGLSRRDGARCVKTIFTLLSKSIARGEDVRIRGLGVFKIKQVEEHKIQSSFTPKTTIPAHGKIRFKPAAALKAAAWNFDKTHVEDKL